jgi:hypothetical protein
MRDSALQAPSGATRILAREISDASHPYGPESFDNSKSE